MRLIPRKLTLLAMALGLAALTLTACGGAQQPTPAPTLPSEPTATEIPAEFPTPTTESLQPPDATPATPTDIPTEAPTATPTPEPLSPQALAARCEASALWGQPKPEYMWINQAIKQDNVTVRLTQGKFTAEASTLEFLVEYPFAEGQADYPARFRLSGTLKGNVEGVTTPDQVVARSYWGCGGKQLIAVQGLGRVVDPARGFKLRFPKLIMRNDAGVETQTIDNTWLTFQVGDTQMSGDAPSFEVNQSLTQNGVSVIVERVTLGFTETLVYYRIDKGAAENVEPLRAARIRYDGAAWQDGESANALIEGQTIRFYRFPVAPFNTQRIEVDFRALAASTNKYLQLPINLPAPRDENPLTLNQDLATLEGSFRVVSLTAQADGFQIVVEPLDSPARMVIPGMAGLVRVQARDNLGNVHNATDARFDVVEADGALLPARYEMTFQGALVPDASMLSLLIENYWQALSGPWGFDLSAPPPAPSPEGQP